MHTFDKLYSLLMFDKYFYSKIYEPSEYSKYASWYAFVGKEYWVNIIDVVVTLTELFGLYANCDWKLFVHQ